MRVLQVISSLRMGGAERLALELTARMRGAGLEAELAIFDGTPSPLLDEARSRGIHPVVLGMGMRDIYSPARIKDLRKLTAGKPHFDIVHTHNTAPQLFGALACGRRGPALVTTEHNTTNRRRGSMWGQLFDRALYARYSAIACCSQRVHDEFVKALGPSPRLLTVTNGIDLTPYLSLPPAPHTGDDGKVILMVSAFREQKDHLTALRALSLLPDGFTMIFAGDGALRGTTEEACRSMGLAGRVTFTGNVADIPALYARADISLLSTRYEGPSLACVEAMASGRPLVATGVPGVEDIVTGGAGITVRPNDPAGMARAIISLATDPDLAAGTACKGRDTAMQYDIKNTVNNYINLYKNILA